MSECKLCGKETNIVFNIKFKAVPICDYCALTITNQNVTALCLEKVQILAQEKSKEPS
jgi:hypothetical protein